MRVSQLERNGVVETEIKAFCTFHLTSVCNLFYFRFLQSLADHRFFSENDTVHSYVAKDQVSPAYMEELIMATV